MGHKTDWLLGRTSEQRDRRAKAKRDLKEAGQFFNGLAVRQVQPKPKEDEDNGLGQGTS
jgi:hypothetical protein